MAFNDYVFALSAFIGLDTDEFDKDLDGSKKKTESLGSKLKSGLGAAAKIGTAALAAGSAAVVGFAKSALETGQGFDSSMSQIAATLGYTTEDIANNVNGAGDAFQALRDKAQEMGAATNFSAQEAADGLNILAMSGFNAEQSIGMIEDVLHLSAAGAMDMAQAAGYVSGAIKGFADDTKDAGYYADLMAKGATMANTSVSQLGEAISSGAAGAAAYGQSADSMTVALLRLAEQGEVGAAAGTALSAAMKNLYTPSDQAAKALEQLGVKAYENGKALDFNDVVNDLAEALSGMSDQEANAYKQTIFGIQGLDAYNKMTVTGIEKQEEWAAALAGASDGAGEAAKQYATMTDNLQGDLDILSSSLDGLKLAVSDTLMDSAREFVQFGSGALTAITDGFKEGGIDGAMDALGEQLSAGLEMIVEKLPDLIKVGAKLLEAVGKAIVDNTPILLDSASQVIQQFAESLGEGDAIQNMVDGAVSIVRSLQDFLIQNAPILIGAAVQLITELALALTDPENAAALTDGAIAITFALFDALIAAIPELVKAAPEIVSNLVAGIVENVPKMVDAAGDLLNGLFRGFRDMWGDIKQAAKDIFDTLWNGIKDLFGIHSPSTKMAEIGTDIIKGMINGISERIGDITAKAKEIWDTFKTNIKDKISDALNWGRDLIKNFTSGITEKWEALKGTVSGVAQGIKDFLGFSEPEEGPLSDFHTYAPDMMDLFARGIRDNKRKVLEEIKDLAGDVQVGMTATQQTGARTGTAGSQPINITVQSILDGKVIAESTTKYQRQRSLAMGV